MFLHIADLFFANMKTLIIQVNKTKGVITVFFMYDKGGWEGNGEIFFML